MSDTNRRDFKFASPIEAFRQARRYILNNALRREQRSLNLSGYGLTELPPEIGRLKRLEVLYLTNNQLSLLPPQIGGLESLKTLHLATNKLSKLPDEIGNLKNLRWLYASKNKLQTLPSTISDLSNIAGLILDENIIEQLPQTIVKLENLRLLTLGENLLRTVPSEIVRLKSLMRLDLSGNGITSLPPEFLELSSLTALLLQNNEISEFPALLTGLSNLTALYLANTGLRALPGAIGQMTNLNRLSLNHNSLEYLPSEIGGLTNLHALRLDDNLLTELPRELGQLRTLEVAAAVDTEPFTEGLFIENNPLPQPYPRLIAAGQPTATKNVLAWLRDELDLTTIETIQPTTRTDIVPPPEPAPEAGPMFQIASGKLDLISGPETASAFDRSTQDALHGRLKRQVSLLQEETRKVSNQHPQLAAIVNEYAGLVTPSINELDVVELWASGNALMAAATSFERQDRAKTITEPLEPQHLGLLTEVAGLHGAFILGFPRGVELVERADRSQFDLETIRAISTPTSNVLSALSRQRRLLSDRARHLIEALDAALLPGSWEIARIGYTSYASVRNALVVIGRLAIWINEKGGSLAGGTIVAAAVSQSGLSPEALQQVMSFLQVNSAQILSFAAPFPELRTYLLWIIDFFDVQEGKSDFKEKDSVKQ